MHKLAFSTLPCEGWEPFKLLHYCKRYGYTGIELRESDCSWVSVDLDDTERKWISMLFEKENVKIR